MVKKTAKLHSYRFQFFDVEPYLNMNGKPTFGFAIGAACYVIRQNIEGSDEWYDIHVYQPFSHNGEMGFYEDTGISFLTWQWDGDRDAPTLTPSFLYEFSAGKLHLFVKAGKLEILPDTTVDCKDVRCMQ